MLKSYLSLSRFLIESVNAGHKMSKQDTGGDKITRSEQGAVFSVSGHSTCAGI